MIQTMHYFYKQTDNEEPKHIRVAGILLFFCKTTHVIKESGGIQGLNDYVTQQKGKTYNWKSGN